MSAQRPLIAGNWKMNGLLASGAELAAVARALQANPAAAEVLVCLPATLIAPFAQVLARTGIAIGGQDCHQAAAGAHTGDISAAMLKDVGATYVIVGHSERRTDHGETDAQVAAKAAAAHGAGLTAIICIGESEAVRLKGDAVGQVSAQLEASLPAGAGPTNTVIAYEPIWAIGAGRTATPQDIAEMHAALRARLMARFGEAGRAVRLLYGGSVKPGNAASVLRTPAVNGALVGGASLKAADFLAIIAACP